MQHPGPQAEPPRTLARNAAYLVAGQVATTALAIVFSAALGRSLGPRDFGTWFLITTMTTFAYVLAEWGQPLFVIRQAAREPPRAGELLGTALALRIGFSVLVLGPAAGVAWMLGYGVRTTSLLVLLLVASLPLFLAQGYGMVFRARDEMGRDAAVSVSSKAVALGLALPALALGHGIAGVIAAQALGGLAALALAARLHRGLAPPLRISWPATRELLAAGGPIVVMTAAAWVQPYLDAILLSKLAPATTVGWFGAAKTLLGTLIAPATILGTAAYPRFARAAGDAVALRRELRSALRPLLWLAALAATGTYLFARTVVALVYGSEDFAPAATVLQVFAPGFFLLFIDILLGHAIYACGRGNGFAVAKLVSVAVGVGLELLLIPLFQARYGNGGIAVVVAFASSELVVFAGSLLILGRGILQRAMALDLGRALLAAAATVLVFRVVPAPLPWPAIPLCIAVFALASVAVGLVSPRELAALAPWRARAVPRPDAAGVDAWTASARDERT